MSAPFIPPQGLYFRLQGALSGKVLACNKSEDKISHQDESNTDEAPWFSLVPGTGGNAGYYLIKHWKTGATLFSRDHKEPRVGHTGLEGKWPDNWFKLDFAPRSPGKPDKFRLVSGVGYAIVSKKDDTVGWVTNHNEKEAFEDQYFTFLWEKMEAVDTVWHRDQAVEKEMEVMVAADQTLDNDTELEQMISMALTTTETLTHEVVNTGGVQVSGSFKTGIPLIGETEITVTGSYEHKVGNTTSTSKVYGSTANVKAAPNTTITGQLFLTKGRLEIPITITYRSKEGVEIKVDAMYKGMTYYKSETKMFKTPIGNRSADGDPGELVAQFYGPGGNDVIIDAGNAEEEAAEEEVVEEEVAEEEAAEEEVVEEEAAEEEAAEEEAAEEEVAEEEVAEEEVAEEEVVEEEVPEEEVVEEEPVEEVPEEEEVLEEEVPEEEVAEEEVAEEEYQYQEEAPEQELTEEERGNQYVECYA